MKKILITGIAGFIGFHLAKKLKKENNFVIGIDNFSSYYDVNLKKNRTAILNNLKIDVLKEDINNQNVLKELLQKNDITHIVHLAAQAGIRYSLINPQSYIEANLLGFINILEVLKSYKKNINFIFASSSSVYGSNDKVPFSVKDKSDFPTNLYGATKKANEALAYSYHHIYKIPMVGLRYFTVYGPFGRPDMAYFQFTKNILNNEPIDIYNNGNMQRDFTYIDDIVDGSCKALDYVRGFDIFNLGNNKPISLTRFVEILEEKLKKTAIKRLKPFQIGEMLNTYADISCAQKALNFEPKVSIEKGLENFVNWYLDYYQ